MKVNSDSSCRTSLAYVLANILKPYRTFCPFWPNFGLARRCSEVLSSMSTPQTIKTRGGVQHSLFTLNGSPFVILSDRRVRDLRECLDRVQHACFGHGTPMCLKIIVSSRLRGHSRKHRTKYGACCGVSCVRSTRKVSSRFSLFYSDSRRHGSAKLLHRKVCDVLCVPRHADLQVSQWAFPRRRMPLRMLSATTTCTWTIFNIVNLLACTKRKKCFVWETDRANISRLAAEMKGAYMRSTNRSNRSVILDEETCEVEGFVLDAFCSYSDFFDVLRRGMFAFSVFSHRCSFLRSHDAPSFNPHQSDRSTRYTTRRESPTPWFTWSTVTAHSPTAWVTLHWWLITPLTSCSLVNMSCLLLVIQLVFMRVSWIYLLTHCEHEARLSNTITEHISKHDTHGRSYLWLPHSCYLSGCLPFCFFVFFVVDHCSWPQGVTLSVFPSCWMLEPSCHHRL